MHHDLAARQEAVASYYRKAAIYTRLGGRRKEGGREGSVIKYYKIMIVPSLCPINNLLLY